MWRSSLEDRPEYVRQIGMVSIENANLEMALAELLGRALALPQRIARAVYFAPKAATARLDVFDAAVEAALGVRKKKDEAPSALDQQKADALAQIDKLAKRARKLVYKRHKVIHDAWGVSEETGGVIRAELPVDPDDEGTPAPAAELKTLIRDTRILISEIKQWADYYRGHPPTMADMRLSPPDKSPPQTPAELPAGSPEPHPTQ
jgi:hypothetical protein